MGIVRTMVYNGDIIVSAHNDYTSKEEMTHERIARLKKAVMDYKEGIILDPYAGEALYKALMLEYRQ